MFNLTQGSPVTSGKLTRRYITAHSKYLFSQIPLVPHFEAGVGFTADFPVNWSKCQRPWRQPIFEGAVLEAFSLLRRLPLESRPRWGHNLLQFLRTQRVPRFAFLPFVFRVSVSNQILYAAHPHQCAKYSVFLTPLTSPIRYDVVLQVYVNDLESISTNLHNNSASP